MSIFDQFTAIDPYRAIIKRDLVALRDCLDRGWIPPPRMGGGGVPYTDYSLIQQAVASGWEQGWALLVERLPALRNVPVVIVTAFQHLHVPIMEDLLKAGLDPSARVAGLLTPTHLIIEGLGRRVNEPWGESRPGVPLLEERVRATCEVLKLYRINPYEAYPGDFIPNDSSIHGHSIWTRAVRYRRWDVGLSLLPDQWEDVLAQPRGLEALSALQQARHPRLPDDFVFHASHPLVMESELALPLWTQVMSRWGKAWLATMHWQETNDDRDWAILPSLPKSVREVFWRVWERPRADGWTTYHTLAIESAQSVVRQVFQQILADGPTPDAWNSAVMDGVSPSQLLALTWNLEPSDTTDMAQALRVLPPPSL